MTTGKTENLCRRAFRAAALPRTSLRVAKLLPIVFLVSLSAERVEAMTSIQCEIRSRPVANGIELTGVVWAADGAKGDYRFSVSSRGSGGTSNIVQSGYFVLQPHQPKVVGSVVVNSGSGSSFAARLSVQADGEDICGAKA